MALLEVKNLHTFFKTKKGIVKAVNDVSYTLEAGKTLGIVGESGSGKSVSAMSILRLLDGNGYIDSGEILFEGKNLADFQETFHGHGFIFPELGHDICAYASENCQIRFLETAVNQSLP